MSNYKVSENNSPQSDRLSAIFGVIRRDRSVRKAEINVLGDWAPLYNYRYGMSAEDISADIAVTGIDNEEWTARMVIAFNAEHGHGI